MIVIGSTRKPTQRVRSFIRELDRVIPQSTRLTRGKQGIADFCEAARDIGASRILLVGSFHGNPGRLGFLHLVQDSWVFNPPTIILRTVQLLRESKRDTIPPSKILYVVPDTDNDTIQAELLANALDLPFADRTNIPKTEPKTSILLVALYKRSCIEFLSLQEEQYVGPTLFVKKFLRKAMGDMKQW
ncbi:MAG: hypothetical protein ACFFDP_04390 [Promethearchaeota archaeon]